MKVTLNDKCTGYYHLRVAININPFEKDHKAPSRHVGYL